MLEEELDKYLRAGEIAAKVKSVVESIVKPGVPVLEIAERIESEIRSYGAEPAFPVNISINEVAAHYTPQPNDDLRIPPDSVVKVDLGVSVDGYIADTAVTVCLCDKLIPLVEAAREALDRALEKVRPGAKFVEVGMVVESTARRYGYTPIYNLSGHSLDRYAIHSGEIIPNYFDRRISGRFRDGAYAIEPFITTGIGMVVDRQPVTIYALRYSPKRVRELSEEARRFFDYVYGSRRGLPFAVRWYIKEFGDRCSQILAELRSKGLLIEYPILVERSGAPVAQFEETVVIHRSSVFVTTRR